MITEEPGYILSRDREESARLDAQHEVFVSSAGYLIHPQILSSIPSTASVADVGTGTGIWLLQVADVLPAAKIVGFDISPEQFRDKSISLEIIDIRQPIPARFQSQFDVVHLRLLLGGLIPNDWAIVASNALKLLRPGGWIQWTEISPGRMTFVSLVPGGASKVIHSHRILRETTRLAQQQGHWLDEDMPRFLDVVQGAGFERCELDLYSSDRETSMRSQAAQVMLPALWGALRNVIDKGHCGVSAKEAETWIEGAKMEMDRREAYMRWDVYTVTGRKPARSGELNLL